MKSKVIRSIEANGLKEAVFTLTMSLELSDEERAYFVRFGAPDVTEIFQLMYQGQARPQTHRLFTGEYAFQHTKLSIVQSHEEALMEALANVPGYWIDASRFPQEIIVDLGEPSDMWED